MMKKLVMILVMIVSAGVLFAGPFGLEMGMTMEDVVAAGGEVLEVYQEGFYYPIMKEPMARYDFDAAYDAARDPGTQWVALDLVKVTPPKNHSLFFGYFVNVGDEGIMSIIAGGKLFNASDYNEEFAFESYNGVCRSITRQYGKPAHAEKAVQRSMLLRLTEGDHPIASRWILPDAPGGIGQITVALVPREDRPLWYELQISYDAPGLLNHFDKNRLVEEIEEDYLL